MSTPISRMIATAASRISWYSRSVRVCAGATVIESPVWTPIGSKFSIEQMMTTLSARSRITSSSYSFQPSTLCSTRHEDDGDWSSAHATIASKSSALLADTAATAAHREARSDDRRELRALRGSHAPRRRWSRCPDCGMRRSDSIHGLAEELSRSSALLIDSRSAPISWTSYLSSTPASARSIARLRAVCPPIVGSSASGRSISMICSTARTPSSARRRSDPPSRDRS